MLLALDTATPRVTVAVHDGATVVAEAASAHVQRHGEELAPLIEGCLRGAGVDRSSLTGVLVGVGPGPFTGLRVGLVTARVLGHVLGIPVHGVCTLDALAVEALAALGLDARPAGGPVGGRSAGGEASTALVVATDARRREVYVAAYDSSGHRVDGPVVRRPSAAATGLPVAGEGARLYPDAFPRAVPPDLPSAGWMARAVVEGLAPVVAAEPLYLRRPDAAMPGPPKPVS